MEKWNSCGKISKRRRRRRSRVPSLLQQEIPGGGSCRLRGALGALMYISEGWGCLSHAAEFWICPRTVGWICANFVLLVKLRIKSNLNTVSNVLKKPNQTNNNNNQKKPNQNPQKNPKKTQQTSPSKLLRMKVLLLEIVLKIQHVQLLAKYCALWNTSIM